MIKEKSHQNLPPGKNENWEQFEKKKKKKGSEDEFGNN